MPGHNPLQRLATAAFHRWPALERLTLACMDAFYQVALLPFRRSRVEGSPNEYPNLSSTTDAYNAAAEQYFARFDNPAFLLNKPFSETHLAAKHLIDVGILIDAMRLKPGDTVVELGAGSCWLSHMLNRYGCRTISIDVSPTVINLGKAVFQSDSRTNWDLAPQFMTYDGHRFPLGQASCDRIVINDAFHHIPNQRELLIEMHRILKPDGLVAMAEPGRGHGTADHSVEETRHSGVLENELALSDLAALVRACGFRQVNVVIASPLVRCEIGAGELGAFMGGKGFPAYWKQVCSALEQHHYIVCYKGSARATTQRPSRLLAQFDVPRRGRTLQVAAGEPPALTIRVTNIGDTVWLANAALGEGWTRLGVHLYRDGEDRQLLDFDWHRQNLPADVGPGQQIRVRVAVPAILTPGSYVAVFDLVVEGITWFADRGSRTGSARISVH